MQNQKYGQPGWLKDTACLLYRGSFATWMDGPKMDALFIAQKGPRNIVINWTGNDYYHVVIFQDEWFQHMCPQ